MCYGPLKFDKGKILAEFKSLIFDKNFTWSVFYQPNHVSISKSYRKCVKIKDKNSDPTPDTIAGVYIVVYIQIPLLTPVRYAGTCIVEGGG